MALAIVLPGWAAALLVTALWGAAAAVLGLRGKDKLGEVGAPVPEKTVDSVKEDVQWLRGQTRSAGAAVGFLAGLAAPSTSIENERIGPVADQVKETAKETGQEALDRGREVAQAAAHSAVETAKDEGRAHGHELASGMREEADGLA